MAGIRPIGSSIGSANNSTLKVTIKTAELGLVSKDLSTEIDLNIDSAKFSFEVLEVTPEEIDIEFVRYDQIAYIDREISNTDSSNLTAETDHNRLYKKADVTKVIKKEAEIL